MQQIDHTSKMPPQQLARKVLSAFMGAYKQRNFYSESHAVYHNALGQLKKQLDDVLDRLGSLSYHIQGRRILYENEVVYEQSPEPTDLAFILHRDGILSLEFQNGLELWEIDTLLGVLHDYRILPEDAEDDIVTALWQFNLPSILYEAADPELSEADELDLDPARCLDPVGLNEKRTEKDVMAAVEQDQAVALSASFSNEDFSRQFQLTEPEREQLRKMVLAEQKLDGSDHVVDVLLYILEKYSLPEDVQDLLDMLLLEMRDTLLKGKFAYLHAVMEKLKLHLDNLKSQAHWSAPHVEGFFADLARPAYLGGLLSIEPVIEQSDPESLTELKNFLLLLDADVIATIGPLMVKARSAMLQRILLEAMVVMARRNFAPLEKVIHAGADGLAVRLIFVLRFLTDARSRQVLSGFLHHEDVQLRRQALKTLLARDDQALGEIIGSIDDPDEGIRQIALQRMGRERSPHAEKLLLQYLQTDQAGVQAGDLFISVCRALGQCGSDYALPYLKKQLFRWPMLGILRPAGSCQRRGAISALEGINSKKAKLLIQKSRRGFLRNLFRST